MQDIKSLSLGRKRIRSLSRSMGQLMTALEGKSKTHKEFLPALNKYLFEAGLSQVPERYRTMQEFFVLTELAVGRLKMAEECHRSSGAFFDLTVLYSALLEVARVVHGLCATASVHNLNTTLLISLENSFCPLNDAVFTVISDPKGNDLEELLDGPDYYDLPVEQRNLLSDLQIFVEGWLGATGEIITQLSGDSFPELRNPKNFLERTIKRLAGSFPDDTREEILMAARDIWSAFADGDDGYEFFSTLIADDYSYSHPPRSNDARIRLFELVADLPVQMIATAAVIYSNRRHRASAVELAKLAEQCFAEYLILVERHSEAFPADSTDNLEYDEDEDED